MPKHRTPKTTRSGGRKPQAWTPERIGIARRFAMVRDDYGSGRKLKAVAGRTSEDWCVSEGESFTNKRTPDVPNLLRFAKATNRNLEWLLTGTGPELRGETVGGKTLARAFAAAVRVRCQPHTGSLPIEIDAAAVLEFALSHVVETFLADQRAQQAAETLRGRIGALARVATDEPDSNASAKRKRAYVKQTAGELSRAIGAVAPPRRVSIAPEVVWDSVAVPVFGRRASTPS